MRALNTLLLTAALSVAASGCDDDDSGCGVTLGVDQPACAVVDNDSCEIDYRACGAPGCAPEEYIAVEADQDQCLRTFTDVRTGQCVLVCADDCEEVVDSTGKATCRVLVDAAIEVDAGAADAGSADAEMGGSG